MGRHRANHQLIKIHRSYTVEEAARTLGVHKNTLRDWIRRGLPTIDHRRPTLIHGLELSRFLQQRRAQAKRPCPPGHLYCVRCRLPRLPAGNMVDYLPITPTSGNLRGICPHCEALIHRRACLKDLDVIRTLLEINFPQAPARIGDTAKGSLDCDSSVED